MSFILWQDAPMKWCGYDVSANLSLLFAERPYPERFRAAAESGFTSVESWWPFPTPDPSTTEIDALLRAIDDAGVRLTGMNVFAGDMPAGERGIACLPGRRAELERSLGPLLRIAEETGCRGFNLLHGRLDPELDRAAQEEHAAASYRLAAEAASGIDGTILVEPLARGLNGAYPLETDEDALALIDRVGHPSLALLLDTFHLGSNEVDVLGTIARHGARIGHVQLADAPGRGEPGSGELPLTGIGGALREAGYRGTVAAEYRPTRETALTLDWLEGGARRSGLS
jgi:hydroxypyruvate isomerase